MKRRILVATGLYPPDIGGPATYARMLEEELADTDIEPVVVPFGEVRRLPKGIRHIAYTRALLRSARECDIVYALDGVSVGVPALLASRLARKPFLVRLGGDYAWEQGHIRFGVTASLDEFTADPSARPLPVRFLAWLQGFVVRRARFVIVPSNYLKRIVATWGVPESHIKVIYSALFPLPVEEPRETIRQKLSYNGTVLITAARLTPWKGVDSVIEMLARLAKERADVMLIIAGDGEARRALEAKAAERGVAERVRFVGSLSKEALGAAIKGADLFVYNTNYEGLPHQLLEVMDLGVPVVTTDIPGNREILRDGVEAFLVPPNDVPALLGATKSLLENPGYRDRLVQNARLRTKAFSKEKVVDDFVDLIERV